jgi:hypothetical protein
MEPSCLWLTFEWRLTTTNVEKKWVQSSQFSPYQLLFSPLPLSRVVTRHELELPRNIAEEGV